MASAVEEAKDRIVWRYAIDTPAGGKPRVLVHAIGGSVFTFDHKLDATRFANALEAGNPPQLGEAQKPQGLSSEKVQQLEWKELPAFLYLPEKFKFQKRKILVGIIAVLVAISVVFLSTSLWANRHNKKVAPDLWAYAILFGVMALATVFAAVDLRLSQARTRAELTGTFLRGEHADTVRKLATSKALRAVLGDNGQDTSRQHRTFGPLLTAKELLLRVPS